MSEWFRVHAVLQAALGPAEGPTPSQFHRPTEAPRSDKARAAISRLSAWEEPEIRDACNALLDAIVGIEKDMIRAGRELHLSAMGVELAPMIVQIGGDGVKLPRPPSWPVGSVIRVWLDLRVRGNDHLICVDAMVVPDDDPQATELNFVDPGSDVRDLVVAYVFEQQARERRRVLDCADLGG